jgi:Bifunctional DNA primase/polymerase, N-terminal
VTDLDIWEFAMEVGRLWQRGVLRRAAQGYANREWRVVPGAFLIGDRYVCGPLCPTVSCHPAVDQWENLASSDLSDVDGWWADVPYSVLLATGHLFDVIETPSRMGIPAIWKGMVGPVAVTPAGRWMFFVEPGDGLRPEFAAHLDVVMHGHGSWVPAPPTRTPLGRIRWAVAPTDTGWRLPDPYAVQDALLTAPGGPRPVFGSTAGTPGRSRVRRRFTIGRAA